MIYDVCMCVHTDGYIPKYPNFSLRNSSFARSFAAFRQAVILPPARPKGIYIYIDTYIYSKREAETME